MTESFAELLEQSLSNTQLRPGTIVTGTVVAITPETVVVNAGLKSEGVIPRNQFSDTEGGLEVAVGDKVQVALDAVEDGSGATRLSRDKAKRHAAWEFLERPSRRRIPSRVSSTVRSRVASRSISAASAPFFPALS